MPKQKIYRCRHCGHEADKKSDNWQHIKVHVKPERLLSCDACEFVTEYKHHLEYHQRNHTGLKPFKCDLCDYQCVNMSMLKSHMKSHSSVCPYQCGVCKYATKYAHSLKMHLRKYNHKQLIVAQSDCPELSEDGTKERHNDNEAGMKNIDNNTTANNRPNASQTDFISPRGSCVYAARDNGANIDLSIYLEMNPSEMPPSATNSSHSTTQSTPASYTDMSDQQCVLDLRVNSKLHAIRT